MNEYIRKEKEIIDKITPEFLSTLAEACKLYGWSGDYTEIESFYWEVAAWKDPNIVIDNNFLSPYEIENFLPVIGNMSLDELRQEWHILTDNQITIYSQRRKDIEREIYRRENNDLVAS